MITEYIKLPDKERLHGMKSIVDNVTGTLVLIPESPADRLLLFHLMNCSDLSHFSDYIKYENTKDMTLDLGIPYRQFIGYLDNDETSSMSVPVTDITSEPGLTERDIDRVALIGFNRER